jgi:sugar phosphate isomerase/epimerase
MDGRHPGTGDYDFKPLFEALKVRGYQGWVSLEAFDFSFGAEKIAADSLRYIESEIRKLNHE